MTNSRSFHWDIVAPAMIFDFWIRLHVRGPPSEKKKKTNQYLLMECFWIAFEQGSDGPYVFKPSVGEAHQEKCVHIHILLPLRINIQNPFVAIFGSCDFSKTHLMTKTSGRMRPSLFRGASSPHFSGARLCGEFFKECLTSPNPEDYCSSLNLKSWWFGSDVFPDFQGGVFSSSSR